MLLSKLEKDEVEIKIYDTRQNMGNAVAKEIIEAILELLSKKEEINIIFGAAPSQNEVLQELVDSCEIPWEKINAFHMDEYIGLDYEAPQFFANFLDQHIFKKCNFKKIYYLKAAKNETIKEVCDSYAKLLKENPPDIALLGIGENGHIAFNDPHVADFNDQETVKRVKLDEKCRLQQVNDGCFKTIDEVPTEALTLTIPILMQATYVFCTVPTSQKRQAVTETVLGEINEACPASILRKKKNAKLFLDQNSGANLL